MYCSTLLYRIGFCLFLFSDFVPDDSVFSQNLPLLASGTSKKNLIPRFELPDTHPNL